jgi:hypothetical protein
MHDSSLQPGVFQQIKGEGKQKGKRKEKVVMASAQLTLSPPLLRLPREIRDQIYHHLIHPYGETEPCLYTMARGWPASYYFIRRSLQVPRSLHFRLLNLILVCRQIYDEATPLFYSTNTFVIEPRRTVQFLTSLTPATRCLIQSWATDLFLLGNRERIAICEYLQHETNVKKVLIADPTGFNGTKNFTIFMWKPVIQEFLCMPKLQSLVILYDEGSVDEAVLDDVAALVKPHTVRLWKQQGIVHMLHMGLEVVKCCRNRLRSPGSRAQAM